MTELPDVEIVIGVDTSKLDRTARDFASAMAMSFDQAHAALRRALETRPSAAAMRRLRDLAGLPHPSPWKAAHARRYRRAR